MSFFSKKNEGEGEQSSVNQGGSGSKKKGTLLVSFIALIFLCFGAMGVAVYFYVQYKNVATSKTAENEATRIMAVISKTIELPEEVPTIATIDDKTKLEKSAFFTKAENGDKVLLFTNAKKAFLYRPSTEKIIDVTVINVTDNVEKTTPSSDISTPQPEPAKENTSEPIVATPEETLSPRLALYNGSMKIGITNTLEDKIIAKFPEVTIEKKEKAVKSDYAKTQVIDLSGKNTTIALKLAEFVGGEVASELPSEEVNPGTDILIIVGQK